MSLKPSATVLWSRVICKQPGNYIGWPTIARRLDGDLLVAFSGDREAHRGPYGKNQIVQSTDAGETWSPPRTVNNSPIDDRDTGLLVTRSGTVVMSWFTGTDVAAQEPPALLGGPARVHVRGMEAPPRQNIAGDAGQVSWQLDQALGGRRRHMGATR